MKKAIFPGSFDPITLGHVDIIERASLLFDEVVVVIVHNSLKASLFSVEERYQFLQHALAHLSNVRCAIDDGLTIEFAQKEEACAIIRGVRGIKDFEYEQELAAINHHLDAHIQTISLFSDAKFAYVSSSMIRELLRYHQDVSEFVSEEVVEALQKKQD